MTDEPIPRDENRFDRFYPEPPAVLPPDARGEMSFRSAREIAGERRHQLQHWTHTVPAWAEKKLRKWFFRNK
jgi:hypothetical protein